MTPDQAALVLTKAAAFDNRTPTKTASLAWNDVIGHLDLNDALDAVSAHYGRSRDFLMPSDVLELVRRARAARLAAAGPLVPDCDPDDIATWQSQMRVLVEDAQRNPRSNPTRAVGA